MKVLFVDTPPTLDWWPASNFTKGGRRFPALSVTGEITYSYLNLQAAAILRNAGFDVAYIDCQAEGISFDELVPKVRAHAADLVVMYVEQIKIHVDKQLAAQVKENGKARVGFVGQFVTALGKQVVEETPAADFALRGEYDESLLEVVQSLAKGDDAWMRVQGISVRDPATGAVQDVGEYRHVKDLDSLPFPAYDLIDLPLPRACFGGAPAATLITSRGCPTSACCWFPRRSTGTSGARNPRSAWWRRWSTCIASTA
jgi:radical SAM superfamily enzyme YgiQ (UPF0313 family)